MLPSVKKSLLLLIILCLTSCENFTTAITYQGKVVKVLDGDSINILHQGQATSHPTRGDRRARI